MLVIFQIPHKKDTQVLLDDSRHIQTTLEEHVLYFIDDKTGKWVRGKCDKPNWIQLIIITAISLAFDCDRFIAKLMF